MQLTNIIATLALTMAVTAAPAEVVERGSSSGGGGGSLSASQCDAGSTVACCSPASDSLLGLSVLDCLIGVLNCDGGSAQCCKTDASVST